VLFLLKNGKVSDHHLLLQLLLLGSQTGMVKLDVIPDLPHGFLNFTTISRECRSAVTRIGEMIKELA
jgi:hypothetical protein